MESVKPQRAAVLIEPKTPAKSDSLTEAIKIMARMTKRARRVRRSGKKA